MACGGYVCVGGRGYVLVAYDGFVARGLAVGESKKSERRFHVNARESRSLLNMTSGLGLRYGLNKNGVGLKNKLAQLNQFW